MAKPTKRKDVELTRMVGIMGGLDDIERRLYSLQHALGDPAKKRVCAYIRNRYQYLFDWINE